MREIRTICHCGKKATMVVRQDEDGNIVKGGDQIQIGGNETLRIIMPAALARSFRELNKVGRLFTF